MKTRLVSLLLVSLLAVTTATAGGTAREATADERTWHLVTDGGTAVELSQVAYLLAAADETFDIVLTSGATIGGVSSVRAELREPTAIGAVQEGEAMLSQLVDGRLVVSGAKAVGEARVYSASGALLVSKGLRDGGCVLDVQGLPAGTYVLTVGEVSVKFLKR